MYADAACVAVTVVVGYVGCDCIVVCGVAVVVGVDVFCFFFLELVTYHRYCWCLIVI